MTTEYLAAVVLAAGRSSRMGQAKMALPWGATTVVGHVVETLAQAGVEEIVVVTGGAHVQVDAALAGLPESIAQRLRTVHNPNYNLDYMILSLQCGLRSLSEQAGAVLVALGDQPQIEAQVVRAVMQVYRHQGVRLVVPSYQMRRGHPWLVARSLWDDLLSLQPPETTRRFLNAHAAEIVYVDAPNDTILRDLDTPEDYARERPES